MLFLQQINLYNPHAGVWASARDDNEDEPTPVPLTSFGKDVQDWLSALVEILVSISKREEKWRPSSKRLRCIPTQLQYYLNTRVGHCRFLLLTILEAMIQETHQAPYVWIQGEMRIDKISLGECSALIGMALSSMIELMLYNPRGEILDEIPEVSHID